MPTVRQLPPLTAPGPEQMARDEAMLHAAADGGVASFRFYHWSEATLSLGYFQSKMAVDRDLPWVRRASGGAAILHHTPHEVTYSLALPAAAATIPAGDSWICRVHHVLRDWLKTQGVNAHAVVCGEEKKLDDFLCFLHHTPGDLLVNGAKVVGSAQRKLRGALLQHGTILLSQSRHGPELPGVAELSGRVVPVVDLMPGFRDGLRDAFGWQFQAGDWTADEVALAKRIEAEKYRSPEWNDRR
jgi:lipoate-protein ligase A